LGDLRWRAPVPPAPWSGVRSARDFGGKAAQRFVLSKLPIGSEDCLYLNVWRPATAETGLPVYVWIHGGNNTSGSADIVREFYGQRLASRANLVYVSINYRLDVFGWFAHRALRTGDQDADSGNFGTLDIIAALKWVRDTISAFGGDPGNVTIAGESAGAFNVLTLLIAPSARGLFHRAVVESGYTRVSKVAPETFAREIAAKLAQLEGKAADGTGVEAWLASLGAAEQAAWLRAAKPEVLLALSKPPTPRATAFPYPNFDGHVLPADGFAALADPARRANVPILIGSNREETKFFLMLWNKKMEPSVYQKLAEITSAIWKAEGVDAVAQALGSGRPGRDIFMYRFDWGATHAAEGSVIKGRTGLKLGAAHGMEMSFFLQNDTAYGNLLPLRIFTASNSKGRRSLQEQIGEYLANFARWGDPNGRGGGASEVHDGLPRWDPWDSSLEEPSFLVFDADCEKATSWVERGRASKAAILESLEASGSEALKQAFAELAPLLE
jgi:para-nitrobenzyl esterase